MAGFGLSVYGFTMKMPLEGLPAGWYVLRVQASSSRHEKHVVSRAIPVSVK